MKEQYLNMLQTAIAQFWQTKTSQLRDSVDKSNRGAVLGGKQLDGFLHLLKAIAMDMGVPERCIYTKDTYLPGFFRSSKNWDFLIISPKGNLITVVELKSQVGSYGNNFNNRTEEVLGSALDLWTAFRKGQIKFSQTPWVGYLIVVGKDDKSTAPVKNLSPHYPVLPEFEGASYLERYSQLCRKLILERHYTSAALVWTTSDASYGSIDDSISIESFFNSFIGNIYAHSEEF